MQELLLQRPLDYATPPPWRPSKLLTVLSMSLVLVGFLFAVQSLVETYLEVPPTPQFQMYMAIEHAKWTKDLSYVIQPFKGQRHVQRQLWTDPSACIEIGLFGAAFYVRERNLQSRMG